MQTNQSGRAWLRGALSVTAFLVGWEITARLFFVPAVLPAPRTKSALSRTGLYRKSVGIDTNVMRYRIPAARDVRRIESGAGGASAGV